MLGPLEVTSEGAALELGGPKQRALLALLLLDAGRAVSTDRLIDALWGEQPPRTAATSLQNLVSQLRKLLGPDRIVTKPPGYLLRIDSSELDVNRRADAPRRGESRPAERALHEAPRRACTLARPAARGVRLRGVRAERDRAARGAAADAARGADRGRARGRGSQGPRRRARGARRPSTRCASGSAEQ